MKSQHRKQAAEKRKREEAMQTNGALDYIADRAGLIWSSTPEEQERIWIGTGDAGEPNEQ